MKLNLPLLLDAALGLRRFVGPDVVLGQDVVDDFEAHLDRQLVGRGTILAEQVLQDEDRNIDADLDPSDEVLAHDLAGEDTVDLVVERIAGTGGGGVSFIIKPRVGQEYPRTEPARNPSPDQARRSGSMRNSRVAAASPRWPVAWARS